MTSIILLEPENSGNVGAVARVMKNFGFKELILVNPKCKIDEECRRRAKNAQEILAGAKILKKIPIVNTLIGTTSELGTDYNIPRSPITSEQLTKLDLKGTVGLLFGRESYGLSNEEINKCDFVVTIPTSKEYPALNLSHSVAIILYELNKNKENIVSHIESMTVSERKQMNKMFKQILSKLKFATKEKKQTQIVVWKKILGKIFLSKREAYAVMGLFKKIIGKIK
ncbi:RNA methyltransferase [Candidatus Woesearchaeota archaeon]|nr:RNA methyltransferase [Candidatus Woesearchaeota archaeon]